MQRFISKTCWITLLLLAALGLSLGSFNAIYAAWDTPITVDSNSMTGWFNSMKVVGINPAIAYYDVPNGDLKFVRATDASGNAWGTPVTVVSSGDAGMYSSLAVVDGYPAISYFEYSNYALKYVRATDAIGSAWGSPITLDDSDDLWVGQYTSLEVVDGYPAISYFVGDSLGNVGYLKYVRATNASGSAWGTPLTLDGPHAGEYDSLAVVSGYPAISYYDNYNGHLKYVRYIPAPEISVTGNGVEIVNGDTTPDAADHTDFGSVAPGGSLTRTFTIRNKGLLNLIINNINLSGDAAGDFTISGITSSVVLSAGSSVTFQVIFSPTITGTRTATVSIDSNDITKHPYWFAIQGKCQNADPLKGLYLPLINSSN